MYLPPFTSFPAQLAGPYVGDRRLESPLTIADVIVDAATGKELRAVQDASLFAGFTRRWIAATPSRIPDAAMLEAKLCGVGIIDQRRRQLLPAEKPEGLTRDGWSWLLEEKTYRRWLTRRAGNHEQESPAQATEHRRGFVPLVIALRATHGKRSVPAIRRPAYETGERLMSNRTDSGDVAAQQDHRQGLDGGYERQEARYRSLDVEGVVPVQQDDRSEERRVGKGCRGRWSQDR